MEESILKTSVECALPSLPLGFLLLKILIIIVNMLTMAADDYVVLVFIITRNGFRGPDSFIINDVNDISIYRSGQSNVFNAS